MSGAHRRRDDNPIVSTLSVIWRLLLVAAVVAIPLGVIALIIYYLASSGRELDLWVVLWLGEIAILVDVVVRRLSMSLSADGPGASSGRSLARC